MLQIRQFVKKKKKESRFWLLKTKKKENDLAPHLLSLLATTGSSRVAEAPFLWDSHSPLSFTHLSFLLGLESF